jgi:hypothetical protein
MLHRAVHEKRLLDICIYGYFCHGFIWALVDVFVEVFNSFHGVTELDVDVSIIPLQQVRVIWNKPGVV